MGLIGTVGFLITGNEGGLGSLSGRAPSSVEDETEFCMLTDAPFFSELAAGCYSKSLLRSLYKTDLVNERGAKVVVTMSSPPEVAEATDNCRTCADYARMQRLGWFALSGRDQRREEFFRRACAVLDYLVKAEAPETSFFADGRLSAADIAIIPDQSLLSLGGGSEIDPEASELEDNPASRTNPVAENDEALWVVSLGQRDVTIQPLSHADFDEDGIGDVLVYMRTRQADGTAFAGIVGYLRKTSEASAVRLVLDH